MNHFTRGLAEELEKFAAEADDTSGSIPVRGAAAGAGTAYVLGRVHAQVRNDAANKKVRNHLWDRREDAVRTKWDGKTPVQAQSGIAVPGTSGKHTWHPPISPKQQAQAAKRVALLKYENIARGADRAGRLAERASLRRLPLVVASGAALGAGAAYLKKRHQEKSAAEEQPSRFKKFVNSEAGAMYAEHLPLGGPLLGLARGSKPGGGLGSKLRSAARGAAASTVGNVAGATAGLGVGALASHVLRAHGKHVPGWLMPASIAAGGLAVAPAVVHRFTRS